MAEDKKDLFDTDILIDGSRRHLPLRGFTTILNVIEFPKALELEDLEALEPTLEEYELAVELAVRLLQRGTPVPAVDLVVSAVAIRRGLTLRSRDPHYECVKAVAPRLEMGGSG